MSGKETQHEIEEVGDVEEVEESNEGMSASRRGVLKGIGTGAALTAAGVAPSQLDDVEGLVGDAEAIAPAVVGIYAGAAAVGGGRAFENVFYEDSLEDLEQLVAEDVWEETYSSAADLSVMQDTSFNDLSNNIELIENYVEQQISFSIYEGVQEGLDKSDVKNKAEEEALDELAVIEINFFDTWRALLEGVSRRVTLLGEYYYDDAEYNIEDVFDRRGLDDAGTSIQHAGLIASGRDYEGYATVIGEADLSETKTVSKTLVNGDFYDVDIIYSSNDEEVRTMTVPFADEPELLTGGSNDWSIQFGSDVTPADVVEEFESGSDTASDWTAEDVLYELVVSHPPAEESFEQIFLLNSFDWIELHDEFLTLADDIEQMADDRTELLYDDIDEGNIENPGEVFTNPGDWDDQIGGENTQADPNRLGGYFRQLPYAEGANPVEVVLENGLVAEGVVFSTTGEPMDVGEVIDPDGYAGTPALSIESTYVPDVPEDEDGDYAPEENDDPWTDGFDAPDSWDGNTAAAGRIDLVGEELDDDGNYTEVVMEEDDVVAFDVTDTEFYITTLVGSDEEELEFDQEDLTTATDDVDDYVERSRWIYDQQQDTAEDWGDILESYDDDGGAVSGDGGDDSLIAIIAGLLGLGALYAGYKAATDDMEVDTPDLRE